MLAEPEIDRALEHAGVALAEAADAVAGADTVELYVRMRAQADALACVLDEVPEAKGREIDCLLDRYDALMASLVN